MAAVSGLVLLRLLEPNPRSTGQRMRRRLVNPLVSVVLSSRMHPVLSGSTVLLTYSGWRSGRLYTLPVMYARDGEDLLLVAGAHRKRAWWRNFTQLSDVEVLLRGARCRAQARRVMLFDAGYEHDLDLYRHRHPHARVATGSPVIRVRM
jgi:deazaflavin-dependent oxidoreductase (nitroreductase family)